MEIVPCSLCKASDFEEVFEGPDRICGLPGRFRMVRCRRCGLYYQNPRPSKEELPGFYPDTYLAFQKSVNEERSFLKKMDRRYGIQKRCRVVRRARPQPGRILDVGCATGLFLEAMKQQGWEATGIELNERAAAYAREKMGLQVRSGDFETVDFPNDSFDVVTLWDVLEHLYDPDRVLMKIARLIRRQGLLVLNLPNPGCWEAATFGPYWIGWDLPRHLNLFPLGLLSRWLKAHGFVIEKVSSVTGGFYGFKTSLEFYLEDFRPPYRALGRTIRFILNSGLARALAFPVYRWGNAETAGTCMTVLARYHPAA